MRFYLRDHVVLFMNLVSFLNWSLHSQKPFSHFMQSLQTELGPSLVPSVIISNPLVSTRPPYAQMEIPWSCWNTEGQPRALFQLFVWFLHTAGRQEWGLLEITVISQMRPRPVLAVNLGVEHGPFASQPNSLCSFWTPSYLKLIYYWYPPSIHRKERMKGLLKKTVIWTSKGFL